MKYGSGRSEASSQAADAVQGLRACRRVLVALVVSDCAWGAQQGSLLDSPFVAVDREVCRNSVACRSCVRRNAGGARVEPHPEEDRCRPNFNN